MLRLSITGFEVDPDQVTELLGLAPSDTIRRGEAHKGGRIGKFNGWWLELRTEPLTDGRQHEAAISRLVEQLSGRIHLFQELRESIKPASTSLYGAFHVSDEQQGIWLDPEHMAVLATCGIGWGLDLLEATTLD